MPAVSTRNARVLVKELTNGIQSVILGTRWTVDVNADEIDVTNFESGGFVEYLASYLQAMISVDGFYEPVGFPIATNGFAFCAPGNFVELTLYATRANAQDFFHFPRAVVLTAHTEAAVRDAVRVSFTARNDGKFDYPSGLTFAGVEPTV